MEQSYIKNMGIKIVSILTFTLLLISTKSFAASYDDDDYSSSSSRRTKYALGLASNEKLLITNGTALSALFTINRKSAIQAYFAYLSQDDSLYSIGASYKYTISGSSDNGFHIGGGLAIGNYQKDLSFTRISLMAGIHFKIKKKISMHLDSGLTLTNDNKTNPNDDGSDMSIGGHSDLFGISFLYHM